MTRRTSAIARFLAVVALIGGFVLVFIVLSAAMEGGDSGDEGSKDSQERIERQQKIKKAPAVYTIKDGDTLTAISRETGVPVGQIERLNPDVDPQILIADEELKLK